MASSSTQTNSSSSSSANNSANNAANTPVTDKATAAAHYAVDAMAEKASVAEDSLRKTAASSRDTIEHKQEEIKQQLQSSYSKTRELAAENPLATAGIAFAAGMLLTTLLRRR